MLKRKVDEEDVAAIVSRWTGIPVSKMLEGEVQKLLHMEDSLRERVVGQEEAVAAVSQAVRRARGRACRSEPPRPDRSCSWAPRASARRSWPGPWPNSCSMTSVR